MTTTARLHYLKEQQALGHGLSVLAYCLMSNHVHMVVVPQNSDFLALALGRW